MKKTVTKSTTDLQGLKVRVYRNLHFKNRVVYSVQHKGLVIALVEHITLVGASFTVQPAGRARVLATKKKHVHAFVNGTVSYGGVTSDALRASYNPYKQETFTDPKGRVLLEAATVEIAKDGVFFEA